MLMDSKTFYKKLEALYNSFAFRVLKTGVFLNSGDRVYQVDDIKLYAKANKEDIIGIRELLEVDPDETDQEVRELIESDSFFRLYSLTESGSTIMKLAEFERKEFIDGVYSEAGNEEVHRQRVEEVALEQHEQIVNDAKDDLIFMITTLQEHVKKYAD